MIGSGFSYIPSDDSLFRKKQSRVTYFNQPLNIKSGRIQGGAEKVHRNLKQCDVDNVKQPHMVSVYSVQSSTCESSQLFRCQMPALLIHLGAFQRQTC